MVNGIGNLWFFVELVLAELIFSFSFPKRNKFYIRFLIGFIIAGVLTFFFPINMDLMRNTFYQLFRFLLIFAYTFMFFYYSFDVKPTIMFSTCVAGYALQHLSYHVATLIGYTDIYTTLEFPSNFTRLNLIELTFFPIIYIIAFITLGLFISKKEFYRYYDKRFNILSIIIVTICVGYTRIVRALNEPRPIMTHVYAITTLFLALYIQYILYYLLSVSQEKKAIKLIMEQDREHYEISKETIEMINTKCHDLKHQLNAFNGKLPQEEIDNIKETLNIYDSSLKTGNEVLDVLITNYKLKTLNKNIELTLSGDASCLNYLSVTDVSSLFGNAIENAIEAVEKIEDTDKRVISINIESVGEMINVNISNFYEGTLTFRNGLPETSKNDQSLHGFGMKSIRRIARKNGGDLKLSAENGIFNLSFYLIRDKK